MDRTSKIDPNSKYEYPLPGWCRTCWEAIPVDGPIRCGTCLEKRRVAQQAKRVEKKGAGVCKSCSELAIPGYKLCEKHRLKENERSSQNRKGA